MVDQSCPIWTESKNLENLHQYLESRSGNNFCCQRALAPPADQASETSPPQSCLASPHHHQFHFAVVHLTLPPILAQLPGLKNTKDQSTNYKSIEVQSTNISKMQKYRRKVKQICPGRPPSPRTPPTRTPSSAAACSPPTGRPTFPLSSSHLLTQVVLLCFWLLSQS